MTNANKKIFRADLAACIALERAEAKVQAERRADARADA